MSSGRKVAAVLALLLIVLWSADVTFYVLTLSKVPGRRWRNAQLAVARKPAS